MTATKQLEPETETETESATAEQPVLSVEGLTIQLNLPNGRFNVVENVSYDLYPGETLGIVGESGSGKSMTAAGILQVLPKPVAEVVAGRIMFNGTDLLKMPEKEFRKIRGKEIGMILQNPHTSLNPVYTLGNQLVEALRIQDGKAEGGVLRQKAIDLFRAVGLSEPEQRLKAYPHQISGGMKQRVVGALAISGAPKVLIADEPTTALDVTIQLQYLELLSELQRQNNMALIFITHDFGIVSKLCDRILVMYGGQVVEYGKTIDVFDHPSHPYTKALLDSVPSVKKKAERLHAIEGQPPVVGEILSGCPFAPRCPHRYEPCATMPPQFAAASDDNSAHSAACWLLDDKEGDK